MSWKDGKLKKGQGSPRKGEPKAKKDKEAKPRKASSESSPKSGRSLVAYAPPAKSLETPSFIVLEADDGGATSLEPGDSPAEVAPATRKSQGAKAKPRKKGKKAKKIPLTRSEIMSRIRSKDTKPEIYLRKLLWARGHRYRKTWRKLPGTPDIWLGKSRTAIFVHGCFWHMHEGCPQARKPKTSTEFWNEKFRRNKERDARNKADLAKLEIKCVILWDCQITRMQKDPAYKERILELIEDIIAMDIDKAREAGFVNDLSLVLPRDAEL